MGFLTGEMGENDKRLKGGKKELNWFAK